MKASGFLAREAHKAKPPATWTGGRCCCSVKRTKTATAEASVQPVVGSAGCRAAGSSHIAQAVLEQADLNASAASAVHLAVFRLDGSVAHATV